MSRLDAAANRHEFKMGPRFRSMMEERISRLEMDASRDEAMLQRLENSDHIRRQMRLVEVQRQEAIRIRRFLDQSGVRESEP